LELADNSEPQNLVDYFCEVEKRNIEEVLNLKLESPVSKKSLEEITDVFTQKLGTWKQGLQKERLDTIKNNRIKIFDFSKSVLNETLVELRKKIDESMAKIYLNSSYPESEDYFHYNHQIVDYAKTHDYFFNRTLPRGWFKLSFVLSKERQYWLVISIHHFGYDDSTIAVGAFLEFIEASTNGKKKPNGFSRKGQDNNLITSLPLDIKPHIISLEANIKELENNLKSFLQDAVTVTLGQISSEIG
jgi:predicted nucleic acid-binding protein